MRSRSGLFASLHPKLPPLPPSIHPSIHPSFPATLPPGRRSGYASQMIAPRLRIISVQQCLLDRTKSLPKVVSEQFLFDVHWISYEIIWTHWYKKILSVKRTLRNFLFEPRSCLYLFGLIFRIAHKAWVFKSEAEMNLQLCRIASCWVSLVKGLSCFCQGCVFESKSSSAGPCSLSKTFSGGRVTGVGLKPANAPMIQCSND